jgi:Cdc6-like AAA superfamily ATPase
MTFMFKPAVRENTPIIMAFAGASGSGKTFSALEIAMGLGSVHEQSLQTGGSGLIV